MINPRRNLRWSRALALFVLVALPWPPRLVDASPRSYQGPEEVEVEPVPATEHPEQASQAAAQRKAVPPPVVDDIEPESEQSLEPAYDPVRDSPEAQLARQLIRTGIVLTVTGTVLAIAAAIMGASDPCANKLGNNCNEPARNRAALTMGIPAAAMFVAGWTTLAVGLVQRRRLQTAVEASRNGFGVRAEVRF